MPTKSLLNTSGSYEVITNKTENSIELTLILDSRAKQLGLPNNKFVINEPILMMTSMNANWKKNYGLPSAKLLNLLRLQITTT